MNPNELRKHFVTMDVLMEQAIKHKFAIAHINVNNLEWTKAVLETANETNSPVIISTSLGAAKYMCGYSTIASMVVEVMKFLNVKVPVVLHLDHSNLEGCIQAIDAGYSSVMLDGSSLPIDENIKKVSELLAYIKSKDLNISVESEVGTIGGEEDGVIGDGEIADINECLAMVKTNNISVLAAGIGNIHGIYPKNWKGLNFKVLEEIATKTKKGIVLHGGSGIDTEQIKKAISLGVTKINVNTELQLAFAQATRKYIENKSDLDEKSKGYDPRKLLKPGYLAMKETVKEKLALFGSLNKADLYK